jgi:hypothetical protein
MLMDDDSQRGQIPPEAWGEILVWVFYIAMAVAVACPIYLLIT